jgi:copper resistance protein B
MKPTLSTTSIIVRRSSLLIGLLLALPVTAVAQDDSTATGAPQADTHDMSGMDHSGMRGMTMPPTSKTTTPPADEPKSQSAASKPPADAATHDGEKDMDPASMPGMQHPETSKASDAMEGMNHGAMQGMDHESMQGMDAMSGMTMGPMQGGRPPPNARSPDYSDGSEYGPMKGMDMADNAPLGMLLIDQLEYTNGKDADGLSWEAEGWYGNDANKLWVRTEGDRSGGKLEDADLEAFWNHNVATFWSTQLGVRQDFGEGPARTWAAFGVQGLAPYWFELEATAYVGDAGRTAARLRAQYELLLTQRLILQPDFEVNLYGKDDPARRIGSGLSDAQLGLRLRYEFSRQFAPYIGVNWNRRIGTTADYAREDHQPLLDRQIVVGVRVWF